MKVALFRSTGRIRGELLRQALAADHTVVAIIGDGTHLGISDPRPTVTVVKGLTESGPLGAPLAGCEAVLSAVGPRSNTDWPITTLATISILCAMAEHEPSRFVAVGAEPVRPAPEGESLLNRFLILPMISRLLANVYSDLAEMEHQIGESRTSWITVPSPKLTNAPLGEGYRMAIGRNVPQGYRIGLADVAHAILASVTDARTFCKVVGVAR